MSHVALPSCSLTSLQRCFCPSIMRLSVINLFIAFGTIQYRETVGVKCCEMTGIGHMNKQQDMNRSLGRFFRFPLRVMRGFMRNQGLLLSGAIAYYTLLSTVPMSILFLTGLSHFIATEQLLHTLSTYAEMVVPGYATILAERIGGPGSFNHCAPGIGSGPTTGRV
jgi:hypothetical protein